MRTLVFGAGWIGTQLAERMRAGLSRADIADERAVEKAIDEAGCDRVVNAAGKTGHPNVDALERDPAATYRSNVAGPVLLASVCLRRGIHFTHLGSGCVYQGDNGGAGYSEEDPPNFSGSLYSRTKSLSEAALRDLGALQIRLRMPLSSEPSSRNLLTKLLGYRSVVSTANSITVLDDAFPAIEALVARGERGVWNLVNPGVERHDEVLALYAKIAGTPVAFQVVPESAVGLHARRSNCLLNTSKLKAAGLALPPIEESLPRVLSRYASRVAATATTNLE
jgi:dTDP-4-dehydrorhamnose reductase